MFNFSDALVIGSLFFSLMTFVGVGQLALLVRWSMGIKYENIEGFFKPASPYNTGYYVQPCTILSVGSGAARPSLVIGCRSGSVQTSCETSVSRRAVRSPISL